MSALEDEEDEEKEGEEERDAPWTAAGPPRADASAAATPRPRPACARVRYVSRGTREDGGEAGARERTSLSVSTAFLSMRSWSRMNCAQRARQLALLLLERDEMEGSGRTAFIFWILSCCSRTMSACSATSFSSATRRAASAAEVDAAFCDARRFLCT